MIKTLEEAREFVLDVKICSIFAKDASGLPSLWDQVDLPEKQPGEKGWGERMGAVWTWKNQLPTEYPTEIFYGKIGCGTAVLMDMGHLADVHFPQTHVTVTDLNDLAQFVFAQVEREPAETGALRTVAMLEMGCSKSTFDTALKNLQTSLNIARWNHPHVERDTWVPFRDMYPDIWARHTRDE